MFEYSTHIRVRYAETDQMGFVYYGHYAAYYEVARVESLRSLGLTYRSLEEEGILMPVVENKSKYIRPGRYDDLLRIQVRIDEMPHKRIKFNYEVFNEAGELINVGETLLAFVDRTSGKSCAAPGQIVEVLKPFFD
jgi:acyl-CoA thioester hydrolase